MLRRQVFFSNVSKERTLLNMQDVRSWADAHDRVIGTDCLVTRCHIEERNQLQGIASLEVLLIVFTSLKHTESR